jgi:hypothetical protein
LTGFWFCRKPFVERAGDLSKFAKAARKEWLAKCSPPYIAQKCKTCSDGGVITQPTSDFWSSSSDATQKPGSLTHPCNSQIHTQNRTFIMLLNLKIAWALETSWVEFLKNLNVFSKKDFVIEQLPDLRANELRWVILYEKF